MAIMSFTFGVWVVAGGGNPLTAVREPLVWGTVLGSAFLLLGWTVPGGPATRWTSSGRWRSR